MSQELLQITAAMAELCVQPTSPVIVDPGPAPAPAAAKPMSRAASRTNSVSAVDDATAAAVAPVTAAKEQEDTTTFAELQHVEADCTVNVGWPKRRQEIALQKTCRAKVAPITCYDSQTRFAA